MGAINIIVYVCLLADPSACENKTIPVNDQGSIEGCMFWAQPHLAEWSVSHPKYRIVRWKCGYALTDEKAI